MFWKHQKKDLLYTKNVVFQSGKKDLDSNSDPHEEGKKYWQNIYIGKCKRQYDILKIFSFSNWLNNNCMKRLQKRADRLCKRHHLGFLRTYNAIDSHKGK